MTIFDIILIDFIIACIATYLNHKYFEPLPKSFFNKILLFCFMLLMTTLSIMAIYLLGFLLINIYQSINWHSVFYDKVIF